MGDSSQHVFDAAIALEAGATPGVFSGTTHPAWANMVGPFGGITAATVLQAVMQHPDRLGEPVSYTVNFCAGVADGAFEIEARPTRTNRSTQHWFVQMRQGGEVVTTATAVTAVRRETFSSLEHAPPPMPEPDSLPRGFAPRLEWPRRYDMRFTEGPLPDVWDGREGTTRSRLWVRDAAGRPLDFPGLAALADVFFPRVYVRRARTVPIGTVSMTVYFHADSAQLAATGAGWIQAQVEGQVLRNGFFDATAQLWNRAGDLLVTTNQLVYYKE